MTSIQMLAIVGAVLFVVAFGILGAVSKREAGHDQEVDAERARAGLPPRALEVGVGRVTGATLAGAGSLMGVGILLFILAAVMH